MIENINNTPQDSGQGDNLYVATTKINNNFDYIQGILNDVLTTGSTISISQVSGLQAALDSINNELANIPTILQDIVDINTAIISINNTLNSQNISITELLADVVDLQSQINLKVDEAPIDGLQYARQDGSWTVVSGGTGSTQNLQQVTDIGNTTTNSIIINSNDIETSESFRVNSSVSNAYSDLSNSGLLVANTSGVFSLFTNGAITLNDLNGDITNPVNLSLINDTTSYGVGFLLNSSASLQDISLIYHPDYFVPQAPANSPSVFYIPYKLEGTYTLATLDDIPTISGDYLPLSGGTMFSGASIFFNNSSKISEGIVDAGTGGNKGIALTCAVGYEWKWEAGEAYLTNLSGNIVELKQYARAIPLENDDVTKGFTSGSYWITLDGQIYQCQDATEGAAVWVSVEEFGNLQLVTDNGNTTTNSISVIENGTFNVITQFGDDPSSSIAVSIYDDGGTGSILIRNNNVEDKLSTIKGADGEYESNFKLPTKIDGDYTLATTVDIPTKTSDLINDGDNGASHFISLEDLPSTLTLYPTTTASGIGGYNRLVTSITGPIYNTTAVNVSTGAITGTNQLIAGLITDAGLIIGNPGIFNMTTIGNIRKTAGSGQAEFFFRVYKRDSGGTETLILQSNNTQQITSAIYAEFFANGLWNDGIFVSTDRIVLKFYGTKVGAGSNPTYDFQFGGTNPVRSIVPVPLNVLPVISLDGLTDVTISAATNGQALTYESSTQLWKNKTILEDAIVNGVTDKAPSQNAVFDALDLTRRLIVSNTGSTVTGTVAETIITSMVVSANTLDAVCDLFITFDYNKNSANAIPIKLYYNTSNSLAGATQISLYNTGSNRNGGFNRKFVVKGTSMDLITTVPTVSQLNNQFIDGIFGASTVITIAPTGNMFFIFTVANDLVGTTFTNKRATVEKMKLS